MINWDIEQKKLQSEISDALMLIVCLQLKTTKPVENVIH